MANIQIDITANGTKTLKTAGKYCDRDIEVNVSVPSESCGITPTGTKQITSNGVHDVTNYASANVNVPVPDGYIKPSGFLSVKSNGTFDVTEKASVVVDVPSSAPTPTQFTNLLTHASTTTTLNKAYNGGERLGAICIIVHLPSIGITTTQKLEIRFRGLVIDLSSASIRRSTDGTTWSSLKAMIPPEIDEHGDCKVTISSFNPSSYQYLLFPFRNNSAAVTMDNYAGAILTINEPIGNGGYVG